MKQVVIEDTGINTYAEFKISKTATALPILESRKKLHG